MIRKILGLVCFLLSVSNVKAENRFRAKRNVCEDGTFTHVSGTDSLQCCYCPRGKKVTEFCSSVKSTVCEQCPDGTFMNHPNSEKTCESCKVCQRAGNLEEQSKCTHTTNTKCQCRSGYFCDKGEECYSCYTCDKCEELGVKVACTATNNTVCHEQQQHKSNIAVISIITLLAILVIVGAVCWKCRDKILPAMKRPKQKEVKEVLDPKETQEMELLPDNVDLSFHLYEISKILSLQVVKGVARCSLTEVEIEKVLFNYRDDANEQTFKLLETWYQNHGERGAGQALIKALNDQGRKTDAERVQSILREKKKDRDIEI